MTFPHRKRKANDHRAIELFAGAGGLGMGVTRAGFKTEAVIEIDRYCCDTIRENKRHSIVGSWKLLDSDVRQIDFGEYEGVVDFVPGGPPCQPFSPGWQA